MAQAAIDIYIGKPFFEHFSEVDVEGNDSHGHDSLGINCAHSTVMNEMKLRSHTHHRKTTAAQPAVSEGVWPELVQRREALFSAIFLTVIPGGKRVQYDSNSHMQDS